MTWATINSKGGFSYDLTDADVLTAARMAVLEGGSASAALWTLTQRFAATRPDRTFAEFVRAFSQPLNPKWARGGEFCREGGAYHDDQLCDAAHLARREAAAHATWDELKQRNLGAVNDTISWATARLSNPVPRAIDFAAPAVAAAWLARHPGSSVVAKLGNWFLATAETLLWKADQVTVKLGDRVAGARKTYGPVILGVAATALGVAGWLLWKKRRK